MAGDARIPPRSRSTTSSFDVIGYLDDCSARSTAEAGVPFPDARDHHDFNFMCAPIPVGERSDEEAAAGPEWLASGHSRTFFHVELPDISKDTSFSAVASPAVFALQPGAREPSCSAGLPVQVSSPVRARAVAGIAVLFGGDSARNVDREHRGRSPTGSRDGFAHGYVSTKGTLDGTAEEI
jgi:hypothetical protein